MVCSLSPEEILQLGLSLVGFNGKRQGRTCAATNQSRFPTAFGVSPPAISKMLTNIQKIDINHCGIKKVNLEILLISVNWLSSYKTEKEMAGSFDVDEKTARKSFGMPT